MLSPALLTKFLRTARFLPYRRDRPGTLPALSVAGALVFTYVDADGHLCVSIDLDTAHPALVEGPRTRATVPLRITVQGTTVFYEPSARSGRCAWAVQDAGLTLYADDALTAQRDAARRRRPLLRRRPGARRWEMVADHRPQSGTAGQEVRSLPG
ncbi:hypothetical protein [Kitasatospora sp. NPDC093679]|uniref:hypothetical protein n=1 Tax=Kitasatospora sp. NPDC093679 TaxID=3154983 RepID=UPI003421DC18